MFTSNILHASTDASLLARLKEMLGSFARADIAVGYFFISGFEAVAQDLAQLDKVRILAGRTGPACAGRSRFRATAVSRAACLIGF